MVTKPRVNAAPLPSALLYVAWNCAHRFGLNSGRAAVDRPHGLAWPSLASSVLTLTNYLTRQAITKERSRLRCCRPDNTCTLRPSVRTPRPPPFRGMRTSSDSTGELGPEQQQPGQWAAGSGRGFVDSGGAAKKGVQLVAGVQRTQSQAPRPVFAGPNIVPFFHRSSTSKECRDDTGPPTSLPRPACLPACLPARPPEAPERNPFGSFGQLIGHWPLSTAVRYDRHLRRNLKSTCVFRVVSKPLLLYTDRPTADELRPRANLLPPPSAPRPAGRSLTRESVRQLRSTTCSSALLFQE